jgi:hypothetical protein
LVAKIDVEGRKNGEATPAFGPGLPTCALQQVGFETAWQRQMTYEPYEDASAEVREIAAAMKPAARPPIVFHGLRKNP